MEKSRRNVFFLANVQPSRLLFWKSFENRKLQHRTDDQKSIGFWTLPPNQEGNFNVQENPINHIFTFNFKAIRKASIQERWVQNGKGHLDGVQVTSEGPSYCLHDLRDIFKRGQVWGALGVFGWVYWEQEIWRVGVHAGKPEPRVYHFFVHMFGETQ